MDEVTGEGWMARSDNKDQYVRSVVIHRFITCDECSMDPMVGVRYKSAKEHNYDLCENCFQEHGSAEDYSMIQNGSALALQLWRPRLLHTHLSGGSLGSEKVVGRDVTMDANIWGDLQHHIGLEQVFAKVPFPERNKLRIISKEWHRLVSDRLSFVLHPWYDTELDRDGLTYHRHIQLNGVLTYDLSSKVVNWTEFDPYTHVLQQGYDVYTYVMRGGAFTVKGLTYSFQYDFETKIFEHLVFNMHTKVWQRLPAPPAKTRQSIVLMAVDTSVNPHTFKVVLGENEGQTQVYDSVSNSWTRKSSRLHFPICNGRSDFGCVQYNDVLYRLCYWRVLVYDLKEDVWNIITNPPRSPRQWKSDEDSPIGLGVWKGRLFYVRRNPYWNVNVWEYTDESKLKWREHSVIDLESYWYRVRHSKIEFSGVDVLGGFAVETSFCNEYLLIYAWSEDFALAGEFMVFNLETRVWHHIGVPHGTVRIPPEVIEDTSELLAEVLEEIAAGSPLYPSDKENDDDEEAYKGVADLGDPVDSDTYEEDY